MHPSVLVHKDGVRLERSALPRCHRGTSLLRPCAHPHKTAVSHRGSRIYTKPFATNVPALPTRSLLRASASRFEAIADNFTSLEQVQSALRKEGLESSNLIIAVDFTQSNDWTGQNSFKGKSLHTIGNLPNPYEQAIDIIGKTLKEFDEDNLIPCYGFGDETTGDQGVFSFLPGDQPLDGLESVVARYRELRPNVKLSGPTSFAAAINHAAKIVVDSGNQYHILLIVADGQVSGTQEKATIKAICDASSRVPLSIIMVGVGDGPFDTMEEFDDGLPQRTFDNFQFVNYTAIAQKTSVPTKREVRFALSALMEIPEQYKLVQRLGLLNKESTDLPFKPKRPLDPPGPTTTAQASTGSSKSGAKWFWQK